MNEQIEKLGEQADLLGECTPTKIPGRYVGYITEEQIKKFAELIVRECAGIYDKINNGNLHMGTDDYLEALHKTFFGVEE
jgi:hypothetical protein